MLTMQFLLQCRNIAEMHDLDDKNKCERTAHLSCCMVTTATSTWALHHANCWCSPEGPTASMMACHCTAENAHRHHFRDEQSTCA